MLYFKIYMTVQAFVFRITGGRLMGKLRGMDICVVKTTGAKSGKIRYIPLMLVPYEEGVILVASMGAHLPIHHGIGISKRIQTF